MARFHGLPLLSPRWLGELPTSLSGSTGSVYCLRDATWLFLRAELHTGIYDSRSDSGKQNVSQGKCSEHFNSQPDGLRMERVRVNKWDEALSPALQKPSLPFCQVVMSDSKKWSFAGRKEGGRSILTWTAQVAVSLTHYFSHFHSIFTCMLIRNPSEKQSSIYVLYVYVCFIRHQYTSLYTCSRALSSINNI